ncbi:MAG: hypothetical protein K0Q94_570 [Paenibacillus sp.]|jgi:hypothetical protein|nr:hypothetical protein [Paenibacillus sp.]
MFQKGQTLQNHVDFDNAMYFSAPVTVWQNGTILDYGGQIEKHTDDAVWINGGYYLKAVCEFRIR